MPATSRLGSLLMLPLLLVGLLATSLFVSTPAAPAAPGPTRIHTAVDLALHQIGAGYSYGAAGPRRFDCSGLVYYSYRKAGFRQLPRTSSAQAHWLHKIKKSHIRRGDLMYFHDGGGVDHAAIFLKWNKHRRAVMLDSQQPGTRVHRRHPWTKEWYARSVRH